MKKEIIEPAESTYEENIDFLKQKAFYAIMELTEDERLRVLSKYAERYGWNI